MRPHAPAMALQDAPPRAGQCCQLEYSINSDGIFLLLLQRASPSSPSATVCNSIFVGFLENFQMSITSSFLNHFRSTLHGFEAYEEMNRVIPVWSPKSGQRWSENTSKDPAKSETSRTRVVSRQSFLKNVLKASRSCGKASSTFKTP